MSRGTLGSPQQHKSVLCTPNQPEMRPDSLHCVQSHPAFTIKHDKKFEILQATPEIPQGTVPSLEEQQIQHGKLRKFHVPQNLSE